MSVQYVKEKEEDNVPRKYMLAMGGSGTVWVCDCGDCQWTAHLPRMGFMSQVVRVTRELFLSDRELKFALGIPDQAVILAVKRETGSTRRQGAKVDLWGCLVTVYDPNPDLSRP